MQPVPARPHLPVPPVTANLAAFITYAADDAADQQAWELLHPNDKTMNHRPTDTAIKSNVMLALGTSTFSPYSILHQRYRQTDHANKTWADLRLDIELIISNNTTGTSRDPIFRNRKRNRWDQAPADNRASRTMYDAYQDASSSHLNHNNKRPTILTNPTSTMSAQQPQHHRHPHQQPRIPTPAPTAKPTTALLNAPTPNATSVTPFYPTQQPAKHTTWQSINTTSSALDSDPLNPGATILRPLPHFYPVPPRK